MDIPYAGLFIPMPDNTELPLNLYPFDGVMSMEIPVADQKYIPILASNVSIDHEIPDHVHASEFGKQVISQLLDTLQHEMSKNHHRLACLVVPYGEMHRFSYAHNDFLHNPLVCDYMRSMKASSVSGFQPTSH